MFVAFSCLFRSFPRQVMKSAQFAHVFVLFCAFGKLSTNREQRERERERERKRKRERATHTHTHTPHPQITTTLTHMPTHPLTLFCFGLPMLCSTQESMETIPKLRINTHTHAHTHEQTNKQTNEPTHLGRRQRAGIVAVQGKQSKKRAKRQIGKR